MSRKQTTDETIVELHGAKSNLLMEAQMLIGTGNPDEAMERYALAAPMEERIARYRARNGQKDLAALHRFSAASCYMKSGSLRDALKLFDPLGRDKDMPGHLKVDVLLAGQLRRQQREAVQAYGHSVQSAT